MKEPHNVIPHQIDKTVKEGQMKHQNIVQALDRILYLTGKQGISYQGAQKTAANSDNLWNTGKFLAIVRQDKHCYLLLYKCIRSTLLKDFFEISTPSQNELTGIVTKYTLQIWLKKIKCRSISVDEVTNVYVYVYICISVCIYVIY